MTPWIRVAAIIRLSGDVGDFTEVLQESPWSGVAPITCKSSDVGDFTEVLQESLLCDSRRRAIGTSTQDNSPGGKVTKQSKLKSVCKSTLLFSFLKQFVMFCFRFVILNSVLSDFLKLSILFPDVNLRLETG